MLSATMPKEHIPFSFEAEDKWQDLRRLLEKQGVQFSHIATNYFSANTCLSDFLSPDPAGVRLWGELAGGRIDFADNIRGEWAGNYDKHSFQILEEVSAIFTSAIASGDLSSLPACPDRGGHKAVRRWAGQLRDEVGVVPMIDAYLADVPLDDILA